LEKNKFYLALREVFSLYRGTIEGLCYFEVSESEMELYGGVIIQVLSLVHHRSWKSRSRISLVKTNCCSAL